MNRFRAISPQRRPHRAQAQNGKVRENTVSKTRKTVFPASALRNALPTLSQQSPGEFSLAPSRTRLGTRQILHFAHKMAQNGHKMRKMDAKWKTRQVVADERRASTQRCPTVPAGLVLRHRNVRKTTERVRGQAVVCPQPHPPLGAR